MTEHLAPQISDIGSNICPIRHKGISATSLRSDTGDNTMASSRHPDTRHFLPGVIAVVGSDGAGKSTLTADLLNHLQQEQATELLYLGQDSGNVARWIKTRPLIGPIIARYLVKRSERAHASKDRKSSPPDLLTAIVIFLFSLWRHSKFKKVPLLSQQGIVVITDRYPQAEVAGFHFDGPGLAALEKGSFLVRFLARQEQRLYREMANYVPALVIRLNIDAKTAHERKPDHKLSSLEAKTSVFPTLAFNGARILDLDTREPYATVLHRALAEARDVSRPAKL